MSKLLLSLEKHTVLFDNHTWSIIKFSNNRDWLINSKPPILFQKRTLRLLVHPDPMQEDRQPLSNPGPGIHSHRSQERSGNRQATWRVQQKDIWNEREQANASIDVHFDQKAVPEEVWGERKEGDVCGPVEKAQRVAAWSVRCCQCQLSARHTLAGSVRTLLLFSGPFCLHEGLLEVSFCCVYSWCGV